jgi:2-oxoglutarate/2-oxoacid ferredoxin oxidoreductase subunit alpha
MARVLMKGNEAIAEAAIRAGCRFFFGYPITPQSEIPEYLSKRFPEVGGTFVQAESEVAAANMIYGCACTGTRVFTSSSSPGISLMSEGASYIAASEVPVVLVNIVRAGPGLGGILPSQGDYWQATRGMGHGDFRLLVLAPSSVQEAADLVKLAFDLADKYTNPVMVIGDGIIGQMMEPVEFGEMTDPNSFPVQPWALTGCRDREPNIITSLFLDPVRLEKMNQSLSRKYRLMEQNEKRSESYNITGKMKLLVFAYGTMARIAKTAIDDLKREGLEVGLVRPITLYPFPDIAVAEAAEKAEKLMSVELSTGQMVDDIRLAVGKRPVEFFGRQGGIVPTPSEVKQEFLKVISAPSA